MDSQHAGRRMHGSMDKRQPTDGYDAQTFLHGNPQRNPAEQQVPESAGSGLNVVDVLLDVLLHAGFS